MSQKNEEGHTENLGKFYTSLKLLKKNQMNPPRFWTEKKVQINKCHDIASKAKGGGAVRFCLFKVLIQIKLETEKRKVIIRLIR